MNVLISGFFRYSTGGICSLLFIFFNLSFSNFGFQNTTDHSINLEESLPSISAAQSYLDFDDLLEFVHSTNSTSLKEKVQQFNSAFPDYPSFYLLNFDLSARSICYNPKKDFNNILDQLHNHLFFF